MAPSEDRRRRGVAAAIGPCIRDGLPVPLRREPLSRDGVDRGAKGVHVVARLCPRPVVLGDAGSSLTATADRPAPVVRGEGSCLAVLREPGRVRIAGHGRLAGP